MNGWMHACMYVYVRISVVARVCACVHMYTYVSMTYGRMRIWYLGSLVLMGRATYKSYARLHAHIRCCCTLCYCSTLSLLGSTYVCVYGYMGSRVLMRWASHESYARLHSHIQCCCTQVATVSRRHRYSGAMSPHKTTWNWSMSTLSCWPAGRST